MQRNTPKLSFTPIKTLLSKTMLVGALALLLNACVATDDTITMPEDQVKTICQAPPGLSLSDIESVTDWINALPKPTSLPCFLESLPRPLPVNLSQSVFSAQPSLGKHNPRVFIFYDKLILSIVPEHNFSLDEEGEPIVDLLEVAYINNENSSNPTRSILTIKGEYKFPISGNIPYSKPYEHLPFGSITICGVCHGQENQVNSFDDVPVYESVMYQPFKHLAVAIPSLRVEHLSCDETVQPFRCAMLSSLFEHGELYRVEFPADARFFN